MSQASTHMELLRGWIGPRVHQALTEALDWKRQGSPATNDAQQVKFEDDGNSLRVRSSKKEYVQICKIEEFLTPVQLWLSDTKTLLKVIVAAAAAERFENDHRRRVTEGTLGAVIQIHDYEIVAQHHGPKRTKITMLINSFIHCGSDGSSPFGTPCSIECQPPIIELLEKLQTLRAHEQPTSQSPTSFKAARDHIASHSQANSISSADDGSQAIFATQIPRLQSKKRLREGSLKSNEYQPGALDESDSARSLSIVNGGDGSDLSHDRQAPSNPMDIPKNINGQSDGNKHVPEQEEAQKLTRIKVEDTLTKQESELLKFLARNNVKAPQLNQQVLVKASEQATRKQLQCSQGPQDPVTSPSTASKDPSPDRRTARQTSRPIPISISQQSRVTKPAQRLSISPQPPHKPARQLSKASTRISGRDIRISPAQRDLLGRADSWYPPEPGHRTPSTNIPISLLQELNSQAERQASSLRESLQVSSQSESSEVEVNDNQSLESEEEPFPTEEWPASSPAQVVLPPDSSLNSARSPQSNLNEQSPEPEHDHDLNVTTSIEEDYSRLKRRPSTNSLFSQSDMSSRSYLPRVAKANSSRPSHHSSKVSTPLQSRSPAPPRNATTINSSPAKNLPELAQPKTGHNHSHDVSDQSRLQSQDYSINSFNVSDKSDAEHVLEVNNSNNFLPRDTANPPSSNPRIREAYIQPRNMMSSASSRRNSSTLNLALEPSNPAQNSPISHQSPKEERSEIPHSSSNQDGKLQSKMSDIGLSDSESESSLETSMPHGLDEANDVLSTMPFTQVNRTPYLSNDSLRSPLSSASPTGANKGYSRHSRGGTIELRKSHLSKATTDADRANGVLNTYGAGSYQELPHSEGMGHAGYSKSRIDQGSFSKQGNSSATDQHISMIEETVLPPGTLPDASKNSIPPPNMGINSYLDQKRKASEPILSPNVTKRRKGLKLDREMSDLGTTGRKVDPEDIGRQLRQEFFAHRKSLTAQIDNDGKDAADILGGPKSASINFPQVINNILPESPTASVTRIDPNSLDETVEKFSSEKTFTALRTQPVVLAPQLDVQAQDTSIKTHTDSLDHNDPKGSDVGSVHRAEVAPSIIPSVEVSATACLPKTQHSVFDRFVMTYPDYSGNSVQFAAICSRIWTLFQKDRMEHPYLWDDFIMRHCTEYPQYMSQCVYEAVDPMPFERYYRSKILQPKYVSPTGPVVTPINIHEFQPHEPKQYTSTTRESSIGQAKYVSPKGPVISPINIRELQPHEPKHNTSTTRESSTCKFPPTATSSREETESKTNEVIEISDQSDSSKPKAKSMGSSRPKQVRRSLPWKNSRQVPNGESPGIKQMVSNPIILVAKQGSSAKTSVFKEARQKATPVSPSAVKSSARGEKISNPLSQPGMRNGATSTPALNNHHPPSQTSNAKLAKRPNDTNWANDPHSPYNKWARNYQAITPGKGNSYAQGNASQPKPKNSQHKPKPFDPFVLEL